MHQQAFVLENLKDVKINGYLIFTDATETGEDRGGIVFITSKTKPGVDRALMNAGFYFDVDRCNSSSGMYWMRKTDQTLRYHPLKDKDMPLIKTAITLGMKTRIDFFCQEKSNVAYDVVNELLKLGYKVLLFSPHSVIIEQLFLVESGTDAVIKISEVNEVAESSTPK